MAGNELKGLGLAAGAGTGDMFLMVTGAKGLIKGESQDENFKDEINVSSWSWGMRSHSAIDGGAKGKATINELVIVKSVDSASTGLMAALRNNELIKKAVLTLRKAGKSQHEFLKITIENGRITSFDIQTAFPGSPELTEKLSFAFQKLKVEYIPQGPDGQPRGGMSFETEIK